jgi:hypothetical protein
MSRADRVKWAVGTLAVLAVAAGCGGSHQSDTAAIQAALKASPKTYLHYGASTWGRDPHVHVRIIRTHSDRATALLSVPKTVREWVALRLHNGTWTVASARDGVINGPRASRPATKAELAAISAVATRRYPQAVGCITYGAEISTVNPRYARVDYIFPPSQRRRPHGHCGLFVGNGVDIYVHTASGWRHLVSGSMFYCSDAPPAVLRSLVYACGLTRG